MPAHEAPGSVPPLRDECQVWWASIDDVRPEHVLLLDRDELGRRARLAAREDRDRFVLGAAVARIVVGHHLGCPPGAVVLDRRCSECSEPHGKPRVVSDRDLELSVSHSGTRVVVAVTRGCAIGVDVERVRPRLDVDRLAARVLDARERGVLAAVAPAQRPQAFVRFWTRKEAVLKGTGEGLRIALTDLRVSGPGEAPVLQGWRGRAAMCGRIALRDLEPGEGYAASLAVLDTPRAGVAELDASLVLARVAGC
jgi:4'-phosphopantetheinyl transferase